jgi:ribosome recycling factor
MYAISNQQRAEIMKLLAALHDLPGTDVRTVNTKRKAGIQIKKLNHSKQIHYDEVKNTQHK